MTELFLLYWPTILAAALTAAALSEAGALLVTRQSGVQALPVSQAAGLGVSLGLLIVQTMLGDGHLEHTVVPLACGLVSAALGYALTEKIARRSHSKTVIYLGAFAIFWSLTQLLSGFFPAIESHSSALFFGDVVTLTTGESIFFAVLASVSALYLALSWKAQAYRAFLHSILEEPTQSAADYSYYLVSLLLLCFSVQLLGLLFTLSALFLPTAVYSFSSRIGAGRHLWRAAFCAFLAAGLGFLASLAEPRFLTTPLIAVFLGLFPLAHLGVERLFLDANKLQVS
jgi:ABC-type Mn2+/Zn2+ transport system permease subunit